MNAVSLASSRAIYDDAMAAYQDPGHPCHIFTELQPVAHPGDDPTWILPVPFLGATAIKGLVFLGLNPSYNNAPGDTDPRIGASFEAWDSWARNYFESEPQPWARLYRLYQAIGEAAFGSEFRLGRDALVLECVRFRSVAGAGTKGALVGAVWESELPMTRRLLNEIAPRVVVTIGRDALWAVGRMFSDVEPVLPPRFSFRDIELRPLKATIGGGRTTIVPSRHLTGVWGAAQPRVAAVGDAVRAACRQSGG